MYATDSSPRSSSRNPILCQGCKRGRKTYTYPRKGLYMNTENRKQRKMLVPAIVILVPTVLFGLAWSFGELWFRTYGAAALRGSSFGLTILLVGLVSAASGAWCIVVYPERLKVTGYILVAFAAAWFLLPGGVIPGVRLGTSQLSRHGHDVRVEHYVGKITETSEAHPVWLARANSVQAQRMVNSYLSDPSVGGTTEIQRSSSNGAAAWCSAALNVADRQGRQYANLVVCLDDNKQMTTAKFIAQAPTIQGSFSSNLSKKVAEQKPGIMLDDEDVRYGIRDGKPFMVASATRYIGWFKNLTMPAGVVIMDESGNIRIESSMIAADFNIPTLPVKVARDIRASLNDRAGYWCLSHLGKAKCLEENTPYEDTQSSAGTQVAGGVNAENFSEFTLQRKDGTWVYVTPMTYYGTGRTITGYLEVMAGATKTGEIPSATLYVGTNEVSHLALAQALTPTYTSDLNWIGEIAGDGDTSTASRIYEVTPTKPGVSRLTIGTATNPQYIIDVEGTLVGDNLDFSWCISTDPEKKGEKPRLIECRSRSDGEAPIGTLRGVASSTANKGGVDKSVPLTDLSSLTKSELLALLEAIARELALR